MAIGGLGDIPGLGFLDRSGDAVSGVVTGISNFAQFVVFVIIIGGLYGAWYYWYSGKKGYDRHIHIFEDVGGKLWSVDDDVAKEITIPGTSVKVFYLKKSHLYLPRGTRQMGRHHYAYAIRRNREWINFDMPSIDKEMQTAKIDFDHTDMIYGNNQLKKLIDRNYRKEKWWQQYRNEISVAILILMLTFSFWFIIRELKESQAMANANNIVLNENLQLQKEILGSFENICVQSGIRTKTSGDG